MEIIFDFEESPQMIINFETRIEPMDEQDETITVYRLEFPHPEYSFFVSEDMAGIMPYIESEIDNLIDLPDRTVTFTVKQVEMSRKEYDEIQEAF